MALSSCVLRTCSWPVHSIHLREEPKLNPEPETANFMLQNKHKG